mmetsp:Transcript_34602/g.58244  ORF Transcript_34602/g.58244 Transcript_34602/m.58244 type:complete len:323 (-) Transcript_34602:73-1041(-)
MLVCLVIPTVAKQVATPSLLVVAVVVAFERSVTQLRRLAEQPFAQLPEPFGVRPNPAAGAVVDRAVLPHQTQVPRKQQSRRVRCFCVCRHRRTSKSSRSSRICSNGCLFPRGLLLQFFVFTESIVNVEVGTLLELAPHGREVHGLGHKLRVVGEGANVHGRLKRFADHFLAQRVKHLQTRFSKQRCRLPFHSRLGRGTATTPFARHTDAAAAAAAGSAAISTPGVVIVGIAPAVVLVVVGVILGATADGFDFIVFIIVLHLKLFIVVAISIVSIIIVTIVIAMVVAVTVGLFFFHFAAGVNLFPRRLRPWWRRSLPKLPNSL